jgi:hypothetical protein
VLKIEQSVVDATQAVGAETLLRVLGPLIERRIDGVVRGIIAAPADRLEWYQGQLHTLWQIFDELRSLAAKKQSANEAITKAFSADHQDR